MTHNVKPVLQGENREKRLEEIHEGAADAGMLWDSMDIRFLLTELDRVTAERDGYIRRGEANVTRMAGDALTWKHERDAALADVARLREALDVIVHWHDKDGRVDESWWQAAREALSTTDPEREAEEGE